MYLSLRLQGRVDSKELHLQSLLSRSTSFSMAQVGRSKKLTFPSECDRSNVLTLALDELPQ